MLVELDANLQQLELIEEPTQSTSLTSELAVLESQISAEERAMAEEQKASGFAVQESRVRLREAESASQYAHSDADNKTELSKEGLLSKLEAARAATDAQKQDAEIQTLRLTIDQQQREAMTHTAERRSRIESLKREAAQLSGMQNKEGAALNRLTSEMRLRRIAASIDGAIVQTASLRPGAVYPLENS